MHSCTIDHIAQVSDAGLGGKKPYTGNYPLLILDTLRRPHGRQGLSLEQIGECLGAWHEGRWGNDQEPGVLDALKHLEDLGLVQWTGKLWTLKKVRL